MELADSRHVAADVVYDARRALLADPRVQERFDELDAMAEERTETDRRLREHLVATGTIDDGLNSIAIEKMTEFSELLAATAEATEGLLDQVAVEAVLRAYREGRYRGEALAFAVPPSLPWPETGEAVKRLRGESAQTIDIAVAAWAARIAGEDPTAADDLAAGEASPSHARMARKRVRDRLHALEG
jgi:hypothetical protein